MLGNDDPAFTPIPRRKAHWRAYNRLRARVILVEDRALIEMERRSRGVERLAKKLEDMR